MAQTNFTPILTYKSDTASAVPSAGNLTNSANGAELAVNTADKRLFTKDSGGSVVELGTNPSSLTLPNGTANGVVYANGSKVLTTGSALTFDGTVLSNTQSSAASGVVANFANSTTGALLQLSSVGVANVRIGSPNADAIAFYTFGVGSYPEQMRLTSTGLGIGTSSPDAKLQVVGTSFFGADGAFAPVGSPKTVIYGAGATETSASWFQAGVGSALVGLKASDSNFYITNTYAGNALGSNGLAIDISGNLLVGTTSNTNSAQVFALATSSGPAFACQGYSGDTATPAALFGKFSSTTTTSQVFVRFTTNNNTAGSGQINADGAGGAAFGAFSDARLKENIADLSPQLGNICALRPVEFDYIQSEGGGHQTGFIAQEMQAVYPDAVGERAPDGMLTITGWSKTDARLVKAIQEQQAIIEDMKTRLAAAGI